VIHVHYYKLVQQLALYNNIWRHHFTKRVGLVPIHLV